MSFQELKEKFKKEICPYCLNNKCNIYKIADGAKCNGYVKDKSKFKKRIPSDWKCLQNMEVIREKNM